MDRDNFQNKTIQSNDTVYSVWNVIGMGSFSRVYQARDCAANETVVIKVLNTNTNINGNFVQHYLYLEELGFLNSLKRSPLRARYVDLKDTFRLITGEVCFVMEKLGITLQAVLQNSGKLPMSMCRSIVRQIAQGLAGLKCLGIVHADLKPDNIMFCEGIGNNHLVKIIDFGWAFNVKRSDEIFCKTIQAVPYRAPEVCFQKNLDHGLDLWSLGCIMPEIVTGDKLFNTVDEELLISIMIHTLPVPEFLSSTLFKRNIKHVETKHVTGWLQFLDLIVNKTEKCDQQKKEDIEYFMDLVYKMLTIESSERITAVDALSHPFLTMIHFTKYPSTVMTKKNADLMDKCKLEL